MHTYLTFKPRLDRTPRVKVPMVSEVYFAWCKYQTKVEGFNHEEGWTEGECYLQPSGFGSSEYPTSVAAVEEGRADNFELDYEKNYYKDHYVMLVMTYLEGDKEFKIFLTPEHIHGIIKHSINCDEYGVIIQPEYSWEELQTDSISATPDTEEVD